MTQRAVTAIEFSRMGDDARFELFRGVLYPYRIASFGHGLVAGRFAFPITRLSDTAMPGNLIVKGGFHLERDPDTVLAPDLAFIRKARMPPKRDWNDWLRVAPDILIEIRSPANSAIPFDEKLGVYRSTGVGLVVAVFLAEQTVALHSANGRSELFHLGDEVHGGEEFPAFRIAVAELFEHPYPSTGSVLSGIGSTSSAPKPVSP